jgi:heat shock protein HslJ
LHSSNTGSNEEKKGTPMKRLCPLLTVVILVLSLTPALAQAPEGEAYVVEAGDWLSKIAKRVFGDPMAYPAIVNATNAKAADDASFSTIDNPDRIFVGQQLWIPTSGAAATPRVAVSGNLTFDQLANASYSGIYTETVTLVDGQYEGEPFVEGSAMRPRVWIAENTMLYGDLNGDGVDDATVWLLESSGGNGSFYYLGAQLNVDGQPQDAGTVWMGDRIEMLKQAIEAGQVTASIVTQGPDDPMCCPTLKLNKTLALQEGMLAEVGSEEQGPASLADLMGTSWVLTNLDHEQEVLPGVTVSAQFADNKVSGSAGCNTYQAGVTSEAGQSLIVGPAVTTRMACPQPEMDVETAYLTALQGATGWGMPPGMLVISYETEDGSGGMLFFEPAPR